MSAAVRDRIAVVTSEIVTAVGCFAAGLVVILGIPGSPTVCGRRSRRCSAARSCRRTRPRSPSRWR
ncbi:hypothetical protein [Nannocystis pusilla]|uniref:hypothetical protein n=1 Tax=Nannocystis pusilla TaxID=889268 RepID=UPI003B7B10FF